MEDFTKTTNGNKSINTDKRSKSLGLWLIMHGTSNDRIINLYTDRLGELLTQDPTDDVLEQIIHVMCLVFRLRDFRNGGHGRRKESLVALLTVCNMINDPTITHLMFELMAKHHGRWNDLNDILDIFDEKLMSGTKTSANPNLPIYIKSSTKSKHIKPTYDSLNLSTEFINSAKEICIDLFVKQIESELAGGELTMCAKWIITEDKNVDRAIAIAHRLFPWYTADQTYKSKSGVVKNVNSATSEKNRWHSLLKAYRKKLQILRKPIPMIERELCGNNADTIEPSKIPGVALQRSRRALENVVSLKSKLTQTQQRSNNPKRIVCAENLAKHMQAVLEAGQKHRKKMDQLNSKLSKCTDEIERLAIEQEIAKTENNFAETAPKANGGTTVFVSDLVNQYMNKNTNFAYSKSTIQPNPTIEAQFQAMLHSMPTLKKLKILFVLDTSASMTSINCHVPNVRPCDIGAGLVALFSASTTCQEMRHKCIAFSTNPYVLDWSSLNDGNPTLADFLNYLQKHQIVQNTNIKATVDLIAGIYSRLPASEQLDMVVFLSDTEFDYIANSPSGITAGDYFKQQFNKIGKKSPIACFWNLNSVHTDSPAEPSDSGIIIMSGYSHTMMESFADTIISANQVDLAEFRIQKAKALAMLEEQRMLESARKTEEDNINTYQVMLDFVCGKFSFPLRQALSKLKSGIFANYVYVCEPDIDMC
jgi:hypothetical protein